MKTVLFGFREFFDKELKGKLSFGDEKIYAKTLRAPSMHVTLRTPGSGQTSAKKEPSREAIGTMFGSMEAVREAKANVWRIEYDAGLDGGVIIYLDAHTSEVLSITHVPEGR